MSEQRPVFDYAASAPWEQVIRAYGGREELNEEIRRLVADGLSKDECWERIWDHEVDRFETDPEFRKAVQRVYQTTGVDVISVTPWVHEQGVAEHVGQRRDLSRWQSRFNAADWLRKITSPDEMRQVARTDEVGVVLNTQNVGGAINGSIDTIDVLYNEGVRIFQLTYNYQNLLGTGCNDPSEGGLSSFGREAVDRINELGGIVDLSHCGKQTTLDAIEYSDDPVAVTHAGCQAVADHYRGKSDREIEALARAGGYMGVVGLPWFIAPGDENPTLDVLADHLEHASSILGSDNVGIGTDFFPADSQFPEELLSYYKEFIIGLGFDREKVESRTIADGIGRFETYEDWPVIPQKLRKRLDSDEVEGILGGNFLNYWERAV
ncbi:MAG: dipeptidase [Halobellus sp.]|uniref:dipeptidase n=1 Tax=Halobellus sp. TaxID=1979212 RepID=UPI0035D45E26